MSQPLLELKDVCREFSAGGERVAVLQSIDLQIDTGEFVAIIGASGSGKSTLMNILGCLDTPSSGTYKVAGRAVGQLAPDELARLRREHFGFVFQRYHLLPTLSATGNTEMPAIYAGSPRTARQARARQLLARLGLSERLDYKPAQLSGGQQQRVGIARALMNGGDVILADEPTGALDTHSGQEVMRILQALNAEGHTVIIVTHDRAVAQHARRIIEISDGGISKDAGEIPWEQGELFAPETRPAAHPHQHKPSTRFKTGHALAALLGRCHEALHMALRAMAAHRLRTCLSMLGISIGIASVVSVVALGEGSKQQILDRINAMGTNTLEVMLTSARNGRLTPPDANAAGGQNYVDSYSPYISGSERVRYRSANVRVTAHGVGEDFFRVRVIGVAPLVQNPFSSVERLNVWLPYTTMMYRISGQKFLTSIVLRVADDVDMAQAERSVTELMMRLRHGRKDFHVFNSDAIRKTVQGTTETMTVLILAVAIIALVVGGIGVMNIMLVSVSERTREIGVRMATGARQSDILTQFLIEAILVCLMGGVLGIALALSLGEIIPQVGKATGNASVLMIYSTRAMTAAFLCATGIGILFGFLPARNAARLNPINALAYE